MVETKTNPVYTIDELNKFPKGKQPYHVWRPFIRVGYRGKVSGMDFDECTKSFYAYIHNESANVITHFVPSLYFTAQFIMILAGLGEHAIFKSWQSVAF